ncbi:hypothetical protein BCR43DRAFT_520980 [Syncephalastrum racemosum]|uniref:HIT-type domain-containing protein n=1 Tax=Syncephalastrum racemosum TaxID=13706 RepID=A0A1X2HWE0_SYNRA|nr:hypothetical protein BCR43DRAFT_520980 [Syncephalastrum racemosum]
METHSEMTADPPSVTIDLSLEHLPESKQPRPATSRQTITACQVCHQQPWKYTCPRCEKHTCCVACIKQHKAQEGCSGERSKTHFISRNTYQEKDMMSDYVYLEDMARRADTLSRDRQRNSITAPTRPQHQQQKKILDPRSKFLVQHARQQLHIHLDILPFEMSRHKKNKSNYNKKSRQFFWTVEYHFHDTDDHVVLDHGNPGNRTLRASLDNMFYAAEPRGQTYYPILRQQTRTFGEAGMDQWVIGLKKEGGRHGLIRLTDHLDTTWNDILQGERIVEYPIVHVWLKDQVDPEVAFEDKVILPPTQPEQVELSREKTVENAEAHEEDEDHEANVPDHEEVKDEHEDEEHEAHEAQDTHESDGDVQDTPVPNGPEDM